MKILITGDRNWDINPQLHKERIRYILEKVTSGIDKNEVTVIHGGARGVDSLAGEAARELGLKVEVHPADWELYGKAAGPIRNRKMLDQNPDLVLAFHNNLAESRGTKDCVKEAERRGFPVVVFTESAE
jgi:hypothetical protein